MCAGLSPELAEKNGNPNNSRFKAWCDAGLIGCLGLGVPEPLGFC